MDKSGSSESDSLLSEYLQSKNLSDSDTKSIASHHIHARDSQTIPFEAKWAFGFETAVKMVNLTKQRDRCQLFYATSHVGVLYDRAGNDMHFLLGHKNAVTDISADAKGKWLVTADNEEDNSVIIWDSEQCCPVHSIFDPHPTAGIAKVRLSWDAKYLVTVGKEHDPILKLWLWTFGKETENDSYETKGIYGAVKDISFNQNNSEHFSVTFEYAVVFFTWRGERLTAFVPELKRRKRNFGILTTSSYMKDAHECVTASTNGWVIIWGNAFFTLPYDAMPNNNDKIFIKAVRLQKENITYIGFIDGMIATGDVQGRIKFYDSRLKILYWCQNFSLPPVISLSFNLCPRRYTYENPLSLASTETSMSSDNNEEPHDLLENGCEDRSDEYEQIYAQLVPSDFTLERAPFVVRDFIAVTNTGLVGYIHFLENKLDVVVPNNIAPVTSLAVHDEKPILSIGYANGVIHTYNYESSQLLVPSFIKSSTKDEHNGISSIQYSSQGLYMACGTTGGYVWFLEPTIVKPLTNKPFVYDNSSVLGVRFSPNNKYFAYYVRTNYTGMQALANLTIGMLKDSNMAVCLLKRYENEGESEQSANTTVVPEWVFHGRYIAHYKSVKELLFCEHSRLFSLSEDRHLVEYNVLNSEPGKLELLSRVCVMQTSQPTTFMMYDTQPDILANLFIISTDESKYHIVNDQTYIAERTILAPILGPLVHKMEIIPGTSKRYMAFCCGKYIGLQILPPSGNPFEYIAIIGHHKFVEDICVSYDGKYMFSRGFNNNVCMMWTIKTRATDIMALRGGTELNPYFCLIEGGVNGWLFSEMQDLFYYMQILHQGENSPLPRITSNKIPTLELPNLMRAVGFFPSEYALDSILYEAKYYFTEMSESNEEVISFENFVKLFINHQPSYGITISKLRNAFEQFAYRGNIRKNQLVEMLCSEGEEFTQQNLLHCLNLLMNQVENDEEYANVLDVLPEEISFDFFINEILGIDLHKVHEEDSQFK